MRKPPGKEMQTLAFGGQAKGTEMIKPSLREYGKGADGFYYFIVFHLPNIINWVPVCVDYSENWLNIT